MHRSIARLRELEDMRQAVDSDPLTGSWFHATPHRFNTFNFRLPLARREHSDWNVRLGVHFTRDAAGAHQNFIFLDGDTRIIETTLTFENPARFRDEWELERLAFRLWQNGQGLSDKQLALKVYPGRVPFDRRLRAEFLEWLVDGKDTWLHGIRSTTVNHPDHSARVARLVKRHLLKDGHDGIVYGNMFDGFLNVSAIAFRLEQITILDHNYPVETHALAA